MYLVVQTGKKQFRVFEVVGKWWGCLRTYGSAGRARFFVERLKNETEKKPDLGKPPADKPARRRVRLDD